MIRILLSFVSIAISIMLHAQVSKTVNQTTAGTLNTFLTSTERTTITDLTITGYIDASDFLTLRDSMTILANLDISGATILKYTGYKGPNKGSNYTYPANEIPKFTFYKGSNYDGNSKLKTVKLPTSVKSFGINAFRSCSALESINIPPLVTTIGEDAFYSCLALKTVSIPASVNYIGSYTFNACGYVKVDANNQHFTSIDSVLFDKAQDTLIQCPYTKTGDYVIPSTVKVIKHDAFDFCYNLKSITIPSSVKSIRYMAFYNCSGITKIYAKNPEAILLGSSTAIFDDIDKSYCTLYVPVGSKSKYEIADQWKDFIYIVELASLTAIDEISNTISIYPNPTSSYFTISGVNESEIEIYSANGLLVLKKQISSNENIPVNKFESGLYTVKIVSDKKVEIKTLEVIH